MGLSAGPLIRYSRCRPSSRTATTSTSLSTRRCFDTCGCASPSNRTKSLTGSSPSARASRICRRRGSATALKASAVVAARATKQSYSDMGIRQALWAGAEGSGPEHGGQLLGHHRLQLGVGAGGRGAVGPPAPEGGGVAEAVALEVVVGHLAHQIGGQRLPGQVLLGVPP